MARWTASAKWAAGTALDGRRDMPLALRLSEGLGLAGATLKQFNNNAVNHVSVEMKGKVSKYNWFCASLLQSIFNVLPQMLLRRLIGYSPIPDRKEVPVPWIPFHLD